MRVWNDNNISQMHCTMFLINILSKSTAKQAHQNSTNKQAHSSQRKDMKHIMFKQWEPINS